MGKRKRLFGSAAWLCGLCLAVFFLASACLLRPDPVPTSVADFEDGGVEFRHSGDHFTVLFHVGESWKQWRPSHQCPDLVEATLTLNGEELDFRRTATQPRGPIDTDCDSPRICMGSAGYPSPSFCSETDDLGLGDEDVELILSDESHQISLRIGAPAAQRAATPRSPIEDAGPSDTLVMDWTPASDSLISVTPVAREATFGLTLDEDAPAIIVALPEAAEWDRDLWLRSTWRAALECSGIAGCISRDTSTNLRYELPPAL